MKHTTRTTAALIFLALAACGAANTNDGSQREPYIVRVAPPSGLGGPAYMWEGSDLHFVSQHDHALDALTLQDAILDKIGLIDTLDLPAYSHPTIYLWAHDAGAAEPLALAIATLNTAATRDAFALHHWEPSRP